MYILLILTLFFSCNSSNKNDFIELKNAYYKWYIKNHLYNKSTYSVNQFSTLDHKVIQEYIDDIKKFELELSQISRNHLNASLQIDYDILLNSSNKLLFQYEYEKKYNITITQFIYKIYDVFMEILNNPNLMTFEKISIIKKQLIYLDDLLSEIKDLNIEIYKLDIENFNLNISMLINFIDNIPNILNLNIVNYKQLDLLLKSNKNKLKIYKSWIEDNFKYKTQKKNNLKIRKEIYEFYINDIFLNSNYDHDMINKFIFKNIKSLQLEVFEQCLKIYITENDEPVWVDKQDTINVINYVINKNFRDNSINSDRLLDEFEKEYNKVKTNINSLGFNYFKFNDKINFLNKEEDYHLMSSFIDVYSNNFIINKDYKNIYLNKYVVANYLIDSLLPIDLHESISSSNQQLRGIIDQAYNSGLVKLMNHILVADQYKNDDLYKLYFYLKLLELNVSILNQDNYIFNNLNDNEIIDNFISRSYMNISEAKLFLDKVKSLDKIYLLDYIIYLHFVNLYDKYCIIDRKYKPGEFYDRIIKKGYIPYYLNNLK